MKNIHSDIVKNMRSIGTMRPFPLHIAKIIARPDTHHITKIEIYQRR